MENLELDTTQVKKMLGKHKAKMKFYLGMCAHCSLCAESCFLFNSHDNDPKYMPSYKFINSLGTLYKKKGRIKQETVEEIKANIWERCALCTRCYCPFGIDIPSMIALARSIMRSQGVYPQYDEEKAHPLAE
ncbi:MAG: (Fe-S)-binding protein [Deltaproteobacteria bacterium]|nr:(Fe-S)-binding protein [Deltaproteobacteria bacterium]